jgi:hypothetical protein
MMEHQATNQTPYHCSQKIRGRERDQTPYHGPEMIGLWAFGEWALTSCCLWTGDDWLWAFGQRLGVDLMEELHAAARERRSERYGRVRQEEHTTY